MIRDRPLGGSYAAGFTGALLGLVAAIGPAAVMMLFSSEHIPYFWVPLEVVLMAGAVWSCEWKLSDNGYTGARSTAVVLAIVLSIAYLLLTFGLDRLEFGGMPALAPFLAIPARALVFVVRRLQR